MLTIISTCAPFSRSNATAMKQINALKSWALLKPRPEVVILGNEDGVDRIARSFGYKNVIGVDRNGQSGMPYTYSIFRLGIYNASNPYVAYVNADIILTQSFVDGLMSVKEQLDEFVMSGQRWKWVKEHHRYLDFKEGWKDKVLSECPKLSPPVCMDYFVFPKSVYKGVEFPPLIHALGGFDPFLTGSALERGVPVVDCTEDVDVIHHDHPRWWTAVPGAVHNRAIIMDNKERWNKWLVHATHKLSGGKVKCLSS